MRALRTTLSTAEAFDPSDQVIEFEDSSLMVKVLRILIAGILLVPSIAITLVTFDQLSEDGLISSLWKEQTSFLFLIGFALMLVWLTCGLFRDVFLVLYVFGHELTHALFAYLFFGEVRELNFSSSGGYILTNRSNIIIALAPYFIPFWAIVMSVIFGLTALFISSPFLMLAYLGCLGASWSFHLWWTVRMIPEGQTDLQENGTFLSLVIIYFLNFLFLSVMLEIASRQTDWVEWFYLILNRIGDVFKMLQSLS